MNEGRSKRVGVQDLIPDITLKRTLSNSWMNEGLFMIIIINDNFYCKTSYNMDVDMEEEDVEEDEDKDKNKNKNKGKYKGNAVF